MPNKIKSSKQYRFMRHVAGSEKGVGGLSPDKAKHILNEEGHKKRTMFSKKS